MISIPIQEIVAIISVLAISILIFFFWMRKKSNEKREEEIEKLKETFDKNKEIDIKETPKKDKETLEKITNEIEKAAENGEKNLELEMEEGNSLRIEATDVIALKTPRITLHKSFSEIRFQNIEKTDNRFKLSIKTIK